MVQYWSLTKLCVASALVAAVHKKRYNIKPDLTCLGKIVGGGMPLAVFGGAREIMNQIAPAGPIYQAGTLSGNPIAVTLVLQRFPFCNETQQFLNKLKMQP